MLSVKTFATLVVGSNQPKEKVEITYYEQDITVQASETRTTCTAYGQCMRDARSQCGIAIAHLLCHHHE